MGGPLFMGILTILLVILLALVIIFAIGVASGRTKGKDIFRHRLTYIKSVGLFSMITGFLGQLIGLIMAFKAIELAEDISPAIVAGGLKVSMITTLYGIGIYLLSILLWFVLDIWYTQKLKS
jgi:biopolymer transport protein ExbB/TolQ